jgi:phage gp36-like protein
MIPYATAEEFELRMGSNLTIDLTNLDNPSATEINLTKLGSALEDASGEINGYLATRYQIPLSVVPNFIKNYCIDIAIYYLGRQLKDDDASTRYEKVIERLKDIEKGRMLIVDETSGQVIAQRNQLNSLIDERGQLLNDFTASSNPIAQGKFTVESLSLF